MADLAATEGANTVYLPWLGQPLDPIKDPRALGSLVRIIDRFRPDIVHTHTAKAGFVARAAALTRGRRRPALVHTFHGHVLEGYFGPGKTRLFRILERALARRTDRLIGVSEATVADLVRLGVAPAESFEVIRVGLDLKPYAELDNSQGEALRQQLRLGDDDVLVAFAGRVVPIKRLDVLIDAVARARRAGSRIHLAIAGDGETRAELERLAADLGANEIVHFLGYRRDLRPVFAAADLAALSSDNEGTPVSLIEAAAAGLPSVATAVGGVTEVVGAENGRLVASRDSEALAQALTELSRDGELRARLGAAGRQRVLTRFAVERLVGDVERLYSRLVSARARA
jgi:glycosyltransferase involved in cell wall biosynthesis